MAFVMPSGWRRWFLIGVAALIGAFVLLAIDPSGALLFRIVGLIATALFVLSVVIMLLTFRNARRLSPWMLVLSGAISVVCTTFFFALAGAPLSGPVMLLAIAAGAMVGVAWSLTSILFIDGDVVRARGNVWYLAVWGFSLALTQVTALMGGRTPYAVAVVSFLGMGLAVGNSAGLLTRYRRARRLVHAAGAAARGTA